MTEEALQSAGIPVLEKSEAPSLPTTLESTPIDVEPEPDPMADAMHSPQARTFKGSKLHPFDWRRQEAANLLGLRFFKLRGDIAEEFKETQLYDGMHGDGALVVWLCTLTPAQVAKVIRLPALGTEQRLNWAEKNIGHIGGKAHGECMELFGEILGAYINSFSEEDSSPGKPQAE